MWTAINNFIFMRYRRAEKKSEELVEAMKSEGAEAFLDLLLKLMGLVFFIDRDFRRNIENFNGRYLFCSGDRQITVAAVFKKNRLKVSKKAIKNTHVTVIFRNSKALMDFLLTPRPDIIEAVLRQDVCVDGNLNYLYKFAFMARRLQLKATGGI